MKKVFDIRKEPAPAGDQPQAITSLVSHYKKGKKHVHQTLLGVTGSGKTLTMAHVIQQLGVPTLVLSHNKTLAAQLYEEFKALFPHDHVRYFVSYYDYYQPEAYIPTSDTYIEKTAQINEEIERLRHQAVSSVLERRNTIVVASVSAIYNLGDPETYQQLRIELKKNDVITPRELLSQLRSLQYERNEYEFWRGSMRQRDNSIDVWPPGEDHIIRIQLQGGVIEDIQIMEPFGGSLQSVESVSIFPAQFWLSEEKTRSRAIASIKKDLAKQLKTLEKENKPLEAERLKRRTHYDLALIEEIGWCKGIENYTRYFEDRKKGAPPYTLIDYFPKDFLTIIDESHMTLPQIRGMYNGDRARKETLVAYGFRLPSALDNRPLTFKEFEDKLGNTLYVSATPGQYEKDHSSHIAEQIVRPTYLLDPDIEIRPTDNQIPDLINEIEARVAKHQRVLVTVLTKRLSETLAEYFSERNIKAAFLHSEIDTLERPKILSQLRSGTYDVLVGINLLREGLDLPEVSLVAILDADKEGFLRDKTSFIQISGRAARHSEGHVILYADRITASMKAALSETSRRRAIQEAFNKKHNKTPLTITKDIIYSLHLQKDDGEKQPTPEFQKEYVHELERKLQLAQRNLQFEEAARIKKKIQSLSIDRRKRKR